MAESKKRSLEEAEGDVAVPDSNDSRSVKQKTDLVVETAPNADSDKYYGSDAKSDATASAGGGMGFLAYAKINPFAAAQGNAFAQPSPRSPKNPFQTTSPVHNPFMSFVDKKEEYWKMMSTNPTLANTSSIFGFNSDTVQNTMFNSRGDGGASSTVDLKSTKVAESTSSATSTDKQDSGKNSPASENESDSGSPARSTHIDTESPVTDAVIVNGEEGEECVFQVRAKMFRLSTRESVAPVKPALSARNGVATAASTVEDSKSEDAAQGVSTSAGEAKGESESKAVDGQEESNDKTTDEKPATAADKETAEEAKPAAVATTVNEWVEVGTGPLRVLKPSTPADGTEPTVRYPRVVMRREYQPGGHGTKLILNEVLHKHASVAKIGEKALRLSVISTVDSKAQPVSYLLRTKLTSETDNLEKWITQLLACGSK